MHDRERPDPPGASARTQQRTDSHPRAAPVARPTLALILIMASFVNACAMALCASSLAKRAVSGGNFCGKVRVSRSTHLADLLQI